MIKIHRSKMRLEVKPLSINEAYRGRRFKTNKYHNYERYLLSVLKPQTLPEGKLSITIVFGFSSKGSDVDNGVKPLIDILQKKLGFNDNRIYQMAVSKVDVKKGEEFIDYKIEAQTS